MFAVIVWTLCVLVGLALAAWALSPSYRQRMEWPKYRFLELERELDVRDDAHAGSPEKNTLRPD